MTILITGGLGFIGSHLSKHFLEAGEEVVVVDNLSSYYSQGLKQARRVNLLREIPDENIIELNLTDRLRFLQILRQKQPSHVIHLAAQAGVRLAINQTHKYVESNLTAFGHVLESVLATETPNFLYASSSSVYGDSVDFPYSENNKNLQPISFYGASKLSNEILANSVASDSKSRIRGMRFFTVYGPWGRPDMAYFRLGSAALTGGTFTRFGDGEVLRDFTYIADTVKGISLLSDELSSQPSGFFDVVNLGGGKPSSLNDLISTIEKNLSLKINVNNVSRALGDVKTTIADTSYLKKLTEFTPQINLETGVNKFLEWLKLTEVQTNLAEWTGSVD